MSPFNEHALEMGIMELALSSKGTATRAARRYTKSYQMCCFVMT